jgi:triacylglycerol lipase
MTNPRTKIQRIGKLAIGLIAVAALLCSAGCYAASSSTAKTKYPIVLVHGMAGFDSILGIDYFYQVPAELRKNGAVVYVASMSSFNDNTVRGEQLLKQMKEWAAAKGYTKFNLIAHSQGGPTARYVHGVAPEMVASITSIGSPHDMTAVQADNKLGDLLTNYSKVVAAFGSVIGWASGSSNLPQDPAALQAWAANTGAFNERFPAGKPTTYCGQGAEKVGNTYFYSITGNQAATNSLDISDAILAQAGGSAGVASDGLVPVCSAHWGKVLRDDYPWNHLDEINQVLGLIGKGAPDPVAFYVQQAARLKNKGL